MAKQITTKAPAPKAPPPKASAAPPAKGPASAGASINAPKAPPAPPPKAAQGNGAAAPSQGTTAHAPPADKAGDQIKAMLAKANEQIKALSLQIDDIKRNGARPDPVDVSAFYAEGSSAYSLVSEADAEDPRLPWHGMRVRCVFFDNVQDRKTGMWTIVRHDGRRSVGYLAIPDDQDPGGKGTVARNNGQMSFFYNFKADGTHEGPPLYVYPDELTSGIVLQWHDGTTWQDYG